MDDNIETNAEGLAKKERAGVTDELLESLRRAKTIEEFTKQHKKYYIIVNLNEYLDSLLEAKNLTKADVIKASQLSRVYAYQIFSGVKNPSRDKLLALAVAMGLSFEECQRMLQIAAVNELYVKNKRDSIIIFGLMKRLDISELNDLLYEMEEFVLQ